MSSMNLSTLTTPVYSVVSFNDLWFLMDSMQFLALHQHP